MFAMAMDKEVDYTWL